VNQEVVMRVQQKLGRRGSLKWIQAAVERPAVLNRAVRGALQLPQNVGVEWLSPLIGDDWAEYRDCSALRLLGLAELEEELRGFWPLRGPQWDALARVSTGEVLLVEAKAHLHELRSRCGAGEKSAARIGEALDWAKSYFDASPHSDWTQPYYQYANRLAHLALLRKHDVPAHLLFVCFTNDTDIGGPTAEEEWRVALDATKSSLGLPDRPLEGAHELFIDVRIIG
jgi:hypothetical protein